MLCILLLAVSVSLTSTQSLSLCQDNPEQVRCLALYKQFKLALLSSDANLFKLGNVFFPPSRITPALVKVDYIVNITNTNVECSGFNLSVANHTLGWTDRALYTIFHADVINQLALQLPFYLLHEEAKRLDSEELDVRALLWNGQNNLPSIQLTLDVNISDICPLNNTDIWYSIFILNEQVSALQL